jgi:aspartyl-tRNA(Asn)/glutamyl-tRNA(Gln) amidotransferase subunit C
MTLTKKDVEHISRLARLALSDLEKDKFLSQLTSILDHAQSLNELNTDKIEPTAHAIPVSNVFRKDEVIPFKDTKDILANAPQEERGFFRVPKILE